MTTNNLTEHMHKMVEARRSGTQTVVSFIERLYGIKILRDSLVQNELGETSFNAGRLYVLLGLVMPVIGHENYMFVKKQCKKFYSPYNHYSINMAAELTEKIDAMITKGSYRDICKHVYVARLYIELLHERLQVQDVKQSLIKYFKSKEHAIAFEKKNYIIYNRTDDKAYQEIQRLFNYIGNDIFFLTDQRTAIQDLFYPINNTQIPTTIGSLRNYKSKY
ncbi:19630_t:CDS:2 [Racocetra persica]|uniref:19630_t:CDS:1 n=1 Tax=Racocetra persica TaxID=160502 RepID=A0ACA9RDY5_9GLOM|nr:19630_t:CDS:2 [Racocetra persica]